MIPKALLLFVFFSLGTCRDTIRWNKDQLKDGDGDYLVSKESNFELGFFSPGNSSHRYVGIWYSQTKVSEKTVVWVANRNNPINDTSGVLKINRYGELVLYAYNMEKSPIWFTNVSQSVQNVNTSTSLSAQLLDTGNLVVFRDDSNEMFIWQSFDYATDTLLPGMRIGMNWKTGLEWYITSWRSQDDPGSGIYSRRLDSDQAATPQIFTYNGSSKYWRSDPGRTPVMVIDQDETYYCFKNDTSGITRFVLNDSELQHLRWSDGDRKWKLDYAAPSSRCEIYGHCGANSKCSPDNIRVFECECLPGYEPKSLENWNQNDGSDGCIRNKTEVSKCRNGEGFKKVARAKYPDTSVAARMEESMSMKECNRGCLANCSCIAFMSVDNKEGSFDCLTWYGDLVDILVYTEVGRDLYVRVDKNEFAESAGKSQGFFRRRGMLAIPMLCSLLILVLIYTFTCWRPKIKRNTAEEDDELEESKRHPELQFFDLETLVAATDHFSHVNELGHGGFGSVYKGQLPNEQKVAIKRLSRTSGQGTEEFKNEVALIARLQHRNLVKLLGCCIKREERMLVLEYMPNKSLDYFVFDHTRRSGLNWEKRFEIINGISRGILYLHQDSRLRIIHRDLKTSNILLDAEMNPKISDFGMARILDTNQVQDKTKRIVGTYGYMSPEYAVFGKFSTKSDVFSFGIILFEIVTGKKSTGSYWDDPSMNLIKHVWGLWREDRALEVVDSTLESYNLDEVMRCIQVALLCVQEDANVRPDMSAIVLMLSGEAYPLSPLDQPAYVFRSTDADPLSKGTYSMNELTVTIVEAR